MHSRNFGDLANGLRERERTSLAFLFGRICSSLLEDIASLPSRLLKQHVRSSWNILILVELKIGGTTSGRSYGLKQVLLSVHLLLVQDYLYAHFHV